MTNAAEARLAPEQQALLARLQTFYIESGFAETTLDALADELDVDAEALLAVATTRDRLFCVLIDRHLQRLGLNALWRLKPDMTVGEQLRSYTTGAVDYLQAIDDTRCKASYVGSIDRLLDSHFDSAVHACEELVRLGIEAGEFQDCDPALATTIILGGAMFAQRQERETKPYRPKHALVGVVVERVVTPT